MFLFFISLHLILIQKNVYVWKFGRGSLNLACPLIFRALNVDLCSFKKLQIYNKIIKQK